MELVSVIIPTYNREKILERAIKSVLNQSYKDIEIIVVDDNALNKEARRYTKYLENKYKTINFIYNKINLGGSLSRNEGIKNSKGKYIAFLDDDDEYLKDKIKLQMNLISKIKDRKIGMIYCYANYVSNYNTITVKKDYQELPIKEHMIECIAATSWWLCPKSALIDVGGFENISSHQDAITLLKLMQKGYEVYRVPEILLNYYVPDGNGITKINKKWIDDDIYYREVCRKFGLNKNDMKDVEYSFSIRLSNLSIIVNDNELFKEEYRRMISINPISKSVIKISLKKIFRNIYIYKINNKLHFDFLHFIKKSIRVTLSIISCKTLSKILYKRSFEEKLDLKNPTHFNEKLMWLKIYNYNKNKLVWNCADKYKVRQYAESKGISSDNLPKLLGVYNNANEINFDELPSKFALKCTHGCGFNIICDNKKKLNRELTIKKLNKWLKTKFGYESAEIHYTHIIPCIIAEEYIDSNKGLPYDYKFYCFNGVPKIILVCSNREEELKLNFYDLEWKEIKYGKEKYKNNILISKPKHFDDMIEMSRKVSKDFPFVRVDFYEYNDKAIMGEMTFTPAECLAKYYSDLGDRELSKLLNIKDLKYE